MFVAKTNMKFSELLFINRRRSLCEQALRTLCLREGDDVADGVCTGHHGNDTVETESDTAVRRSTELESVKQEAELDRKSVV